MFISGVCFREVKKEMERTYKLDLQSINDAKDFVVAINKLDSEVDARYGVRVVDAKSMFGLLNMSHCKPLETTIYSNDENEINEFAKICKRYEVKKNDK
jgi:hypothetical protein|nr:MAG TPA: HISTIDINE-CONTAINING PROTEIN, TRANSFERASE.6A [Bacteriophage sp.]